MAKDTKERILSAALEMFSRNGYAGTNIRELTASLGLVKSSMYKHFENKEEIWNALLDEMVAYYDEHFGSPERLPPVPSSVEELTAMTMRMVNFTVHDEKIVRTRKLLSIEQFRDERAKALASKHFLTGLAEMFTAVFAGMMDRGLFRREDPAMLALAYTAPVSALIHQCDRAPETIPENTARIEAFSRYFGREHAARPLADVTIRPLADSEIPAALAFAWKVFAAYESPDYAPEGTAEFCRCLRDASYLEGILYYGAFDGDKLAGLLGIRGQKRHICFFFVDGQYQRRGIGRKLFRRVLEDYPGQRITLNSSPFGLPFYRALGLTAEGGEQTVNGIRFTPMVYNGGNPA